MKKQLILAAVVLGFASVGTASAQVAVGFSANSRGLDRFGLSIGEPARPAPIAERVVVPPSQMEVVYFIANRAHVPVRAVIALRQAGFSWFEIGDRYRFAREEYYPLLVRHGLCDADWNVGHKHSYSRDDKRYEGYRGHDREGRLSWYRR